MKKSRFTESQIVSILKEADAGLKVSEIYRKHGISDATYYNWKCHPPSMQNESWRTPILNCLLDRGVYVKKYNDVVAFDKLVSWSPVFFRRK